MGTDQKINVCHLISGDLWAGAEVQAYELLRSLATDPRLALAVIVLNEGKLADKLRNLKLPVTVIEESRHGFFEILRLAKDHLNQKNIDIIHSHRYKENILAGRLKEAGLAKYLVQTVHGAPEASSGLGKIKARLHGLWNQRSTRKHFDRVIAVSHDLEKILRTSVDASKLVVAHNAVDPGDIRATREPSAVKKEFGLAPTAPLVISAGRMVPVKAYDDLLRAASEIVVHRPQARFILAGDGPEKNRLELLARQTGLSNNVIFPGFRDDIFDLINAADLFVMSSRHEGIPMVLLETMALGKPVVATAVGGIREVIIPEVSGLLVEFGNPDALAAACGRVLDDSSLAAKLGGGARQRIIDEFSIDTLRRRVTEIYLTLAGRT